MKICLDSNIFAELDFIDWLIINKNKFIISLSVIVSLETLYWYKLRGLSLDDFNLDISKFSPSHENLSFSNIDFISESAIQSGIKFKHHARDIIIGSHALQCKSKLVTLNKNHFQWMKDSILTPDELVSLIID